MHLLALAGHPRETSNYYNNEYADPRAAMTAVGKCKKSIGIATATTSMVTNAKTTRTRYEKALLCSVECCAVCGVKAPGRCSAELRPRENCLNFKQHFANEKPLHNSCDMPTVN